MEKTESGAYEVKLVRENHWFNTQSIRMFWQQNGEGLAVKLARRKTKKTIVHHFEIFRMHQSNIPVEVLPVEDNIIAFCWDPSGRRFGILHGNPARPSVSFYFMREKKIKLIKTLDQVHANCMFWSPSGNNVVVAGLGDKMGALTFVHATNNHFDITAESEHLMCTDVEWDPSGRFVITSTTQPIEVSQSNWRAGMENGYKIWSAAGTVLCNVGLDTCYQVAWRPRPKSLLSKEEADAVEKTLREKYWKKFEDEDDEIKQSQLSGAAKAKNTWKQEWKAYRALKEQEYASEAAERCKLRNGMESDDEDDYEQIEVITEEEISVSVSTTPRA